MTTSHVLIIGAGAAGMSAACRLLERGIHNLIVLEAGSRIGGRIHTTKFGNSVVDMGAHWVHGETGNVVSTMSQPLNMLSSTITEITDTLFVSSSGDWLSADTCEKFLSIMTEIEINGDELLKTSNGSLGGYLIKEFHSKLSSNNPSNVEMYYAKCFLDWFEKFQNSIDGSDSWFYTSGRGHTEYRECDGNPLQTWKTGGYLNLFDLLMKKLPDPKNELPIKNKILFNKEVVNIEWDHVEGDKARVKCLDGSTFYANHIIVTASLGVLKERFKSLFTPGLPPNKLTAINGLSIGTVDKIYLRFPHQWWPQGALGFSFLWSDEDIYNFNKNHKTEGGKHWLTDVFGFYEVDLNPNVLCGWIIGPSARTMEGLSETEVTNSCMELLIRFLGSRFKIPRPVEMLRSSWSLNPHFRGSYSFRSMDTEAASAVPAQLAEPLTNSRGKQTVLFAGEATHDHFYSTVHGAVETGWREADRVIELLSQDTNSNGMPTVNGENTVACSQVIIVGAGMAGFGAARTLLESGVHDIIILEAQDRAGGRVLSWPLNGCWVEAGAQWIHGQENAVWRLADQFNLLSEYTSSEGQGPYIREDGVIFEPKLVFEVDNVVSEILTNCEKFSKLPSNSVKAPLSIGQHLQCEFLQYLDNCPDDSKEVRLRKEELFDWHIRFQKIDNSSNMLDTLSARSWGNYSFCGGTDYVNFKRGYSSLVDVLTLNLPKGVLKLNTPVTCIRWEKNIPITTGIKLPHPPVVVSCSNGMSFSAQHCIVTCSLGVLKEHWESLFEPVLPPTIIRAIEDMGFATINKIYLDFQRPWWASDVKGFQLIWSKGSDTTDWTRDLTGFDVLPNAPGVLLGWVGGAGAVWVEQLSEGEIGRQCVALLERFTRRTDIPEPRRVMRTTWHSNPYVRGGYSHTTTTCDASRVGPATLAQPICTYVAGRPEHPSILLAGEAAHDCFFSTTHGAYESGQKQANVILEYHRLANK